jgi:Fe-S-cluster-containing dehydrogenase component/DMSO reductase anchor subunit
MTDSPFALPKNDSSGLRTLIDELLAEQKELTAVEAFSRAHESSRLQSYRELMPVTPPAAGQQYGFEVNLDACSGCKACVSACHSLNGLDDGETWRDVGLLIDAPDALDFRRKTARAFQQNITTACHHCIDPACLNGCPVLAYDKNSITGVVRHLDDQCIGCQYCVMMCPYEVPQYSKQRGIVRKCDMCHSRLAVGEAPACAQACPTKAIRIAVVDQPKVRAKYRPLPGLNPNRGSDLFLAESPDPSITLPTTRYLTERNLPGNIYASDHSVVRPSAPHFPLALLLILSQLAVGTSVAAVFSKAEHPLLLISGVSGIAALLAGTFHLGQPLKAWRSFLGWRKSWFSREVIALSAFGFLILSAITTNALSLSPAAVKFFETLAAAAGLFTVACSAMIYIKTKREFWNPTQCFGRFFGTAALLGSAALLLTISLGAKATSPKLLTFTLAAITFVKLVFEHRVFRKLVDDESARQTSLNKTALLLSGQLNVFVRARIVFGVLGGLVIPLSGLLQSSNSNGSPALAFVALGLCLAGELTERRLFFTAVVPKKMPGALA